LKDVLQGLHERDLVSALVQGWGVQADSLQYVAIGGGSYHWSAGAQYWLTVDDLEHKEFLGSSPAAAFASLRSALDTAVALRDAGLEFVVAPLPTLRGASLWRISERFALAVYPFMHATSHGFYDKWSSAEHLQLLDLLARLHCAAPAASAVARPATLELAHRAGLEDALRTIDIPWAGGPYTEPARELLGSRAAAVRKLLETFESLAAYLTAAGAAPVITHGEPHPGNVLTLNERFLLVDWDTVALAQPERDLWMLASRDASLYAYEQATGHHVDPDAIRFFRLRWHLDDVSSFLQVLRSPHRQTADTEHAWRSLVMSLDSP
jgi:spectinomycin phosphotransferase